MKPEKMRERLRKARLAEIASVQSLGFGDPAESRGAISAYDHALEMLECVIAKRHVRELGENVCRRCGSPMRRVRR